MTKIDNEIQNGYLRRSGWRGRIVTTYSHHYRGRQEVTERFHTHPWLLSISIVWRGQYIDDLVTKSKLRRYSIHFYTRSTLHRVNAAEKGTRSLFFGFFRSQKEKSNYTVKTSEGFCHYSELTLVELRHKAPKDKAQYVNPQI